MARIPYYDPEAAEPATREFIDRMPKLNIFRMLGHAGRTGTDFIRLGSSILLGGGLDPGLRELAIIRTGILCGSAYEVHQHRRIGTLVGLPPEKIEALAEGPSSPAFSERERLALRLAEEIVTGRRATEETLAEVDRELGHALAVELTIAIVYYMGVSCFLETFGIEIEKKQ
jgi:4-carboxymuconolactone decarboxylase